MGEQARLIDDNDQHALLAAFHEHRADIMVAGDRYIYSTLKSRLPFLDIDHVRHLGYAGYTGMIEFARQLVAALESPVWERARRPPPWRMNTREALAA
jgi:nitrogenase molybdenum-cofactor synthesis protein NifE